MDRLTPEERAELDALNAEAAGGRAVGGGRGGQIPAGFRVAMEAASAPGRGTLRGQYGGIPRLGLGAMGVGTVGGFVGGPIGAAAGAGAGEWLEQQIRGVSEPGNIVGETLLSGLGSALPALWRGARYFKDSINPSVAKQATAKAAQVAEESTALSAAREKIEKAMSDAFYKSERAKAKDDILDLAKPSKDYKALYKAAEDAGAYDTVVKPTEFPRTLRTTGEIMRNTSEANPVQKAAVRIHQVFEEGGTLGQVEDELRQLTRLRSSQAELLYGQIKDDLADHPLGSLIIEAADEFRKNQGRKIARDLLEKAAPLDAPFKVNSAAADFTKYKEALRSRLPDAEYRALEDALINEQRAVASGPTPVRPAETFQPEGPFQPDLPGPFATWLGRSVGAGVGGGLGYMIGGYPGSIVGGPVGAGVGNAIAFSGPAYRAYQATRSPLLEAVGGGVGAGVPNYLEAASDTAQGIQGIQDYFSQFFAGGE